MRRTAAALLLLPTMALASSPRVATDIAPVHSMAAIVMEGVGEPDLLVQPGASPHRYSLRPSEAGALQEADLVLWISESLTPWLAGSLNSLAPDAARIELLETEGTLRHDYREGAAFESHDHHGEEHAGEGHHHGDIDPHAWLDPENARVWLDRIASELARLDPDHESLYRRNADTAREELGELQTQLKQQVQGLSELRFIVFHAAYQYFERRFGIRAEGAISLGDASDPSPARVKKLRDLTASLNINCVFTEPQYNPGLVASVFAPTQVRATPVMDPLGAHLTPGPELYTELLRDLVGSLQECGETA